MDRAELATLYRQARGEKLSGRQLKTAMATMDADGSGDIEFKEFQAWCEHTAVSSYLAVCLAACYLTYMCGTRSTRWLASCCLPGSA